MILPTQPDRKSDKITFLTASAALALSAQDAAETAASLQQGIDTAGKTIAYSSIGSRKHSLKMRSRCSSRIGSSAPLTTGSLAVKPGR